MPERPKAAGQADPPEPPARGEQITLDGVSADELTAVARIVSRLNSGELTKTRSKTDKIGAVLASIDLDVTLSREGTVLGRVAKSGDEYRFVPAAP